MSKEKQMIEEMAKILCGMKNGCDGCMWGKVHCNERNCAEEIYNAGYRKQSVGEWLQGVHNSKVCSMCGKEPLYTASGTAFATTFYRVKSNYCPNCGAKMKGGAE